VDGLSVVGQQGGCRWSANGEQGSAKQMMRASTFKKGFAQPNSIGADAGKARASEEVQVQRQRRGEVRAGAA